MSYINPLRRRYFPQKLTYWSQKTQDGYGGENWDVPQIIPCRWEDTEMERLSVAYRAEGESTLSNAHVYTPMPLKEGGYVMLGQSAEANPSRLDKAFVIRAVSEVPSLKGDFVEHVSTL